MKRPLSIIVFLACIWQVALVSRTAHALTPLETPLQEHTARPSRAPLIDYRKGRLTAKIDNVTLGEIIGELERVTGLKANINGSVGELPVFVKLEGVSLKEAVTTILNGFSYVMFPAPTGLMVVVLSTQPKAAEIHRTATFPPNKIVTPELEPLGVEVVVPAASSNSAAMAIPQTLDEFRSIQGEAIGQDPDADNGESTDNAELFLTQQRGQEARLDRALDTLSSDYKHLFNDAINELVGIDDPKATKALIDAAVTPSDGISRITAVEALSHHATNLQFADQEAMDILKQFVDDSDEQVRKVARDTLAEMQGLEQMKRTH